MDKKNMLICVLVIITFIMVGFALVSNDLFKTNNANKTSTLTLNETGNNSTVKHINNEKTVQQSNNQQTDNYMRDANGNIMYAKSDDGKSYPMTTDGRYTWEEADPSLPGREEAGYWVDKSY